jgi:4-diphosphocytidyl-2-C-methyl-D-erythritol kinase
VSSPRRATLHEDAPAKVNLTLRVLGLRSDGYHKIESLVAFAQVHDRLSLRPGGQLKLKVSGPTSAKTGRLAGNLVLKAARLLSAAVDDLTLGQFTLVKNLPVAAGIGGGSADAAAALRLLARANGLKLNDPRIREVALKIGADVPICLFLRARVMRGIGEILSSPVRIAKLATVLVNPGVTVATRDVFARYDRQKARHKPKSGLRNAAVPRKPAALFAMLAVNRNDLEPAAAALVPAIAKVLEALRDSSGCRIARMSGSGATCYGLFVSPRAAAAAARKLKAAHPRWWVKASVLR